MDFAYSPRCQDYLARARQFMADELAPRQADYLAALKREPWQVPAVMKTLKAKAREQGLWNLFLPDEVHGAGLSNVEYAPLAEAMGRSLIAPEIFNCNAPDTGNMEVLAKYGTPAQQEEWLTPLLAGEIRSAF